MLRCLAASNGLRSLCANASLLGDYDFVLDAIARNRSGPSKQRCTAQQNIRFRFSVGSSGEAGRRVPRALNKNRSFHKCCAKCRSLLCLQKPPDRLLLPNDGFRKPLCVQQMYMLKQDACWYARGPLRRIQHLKWRTNSRSWFKLR